MLYHIIADYIPHISLRITVDQNNHTNCLTWKKNRKYYYIYVDLYTIFVFIEIQGIISFSHLVYVEKIFLTRMM